jgi:hypothetical protein
MQSGSLQKYLTSNSKQPVIPNGELRNLSLIYHREIENNKICNEEIMKSSFNDDFLKPDSYLPSSASKRFTTNVFSC